MLIFLRTNQFFLFELFVLVRLAALSMFTITLHVLIQDKYCFNIYGQASDFCKNIHSSSEDSITKDDILADSVKFINYKNILELVPMFILSLYIGPFLDTYKYSTQLLLLFTALGDVFSSVASLASLYYFEISPYWLLICSLSVWFTGGSICFHTTVYRHIVVTSTESFRPIKFTLFQLCYRIAQSFGTYVGGHILKFDNSYQLRTYSRNLYVIITMNVASFLIMIALTINDNSLRSILAGYDLRHDEFVETQEIAYEIGDQRPTFFSLLFKNKNVRDTLGCLVKRRPNRIRTQIYLLFVVIFFHVSVVFGVDDILLQFCEKVFHWNVANYSDFFALAKLIPVFMLVAASYILVRWLQINEGSLLIMSQISEFFGHIIIGSFLKPLYYYISIPIGALSGFATIGVRTRLSKIVAPHELGKIFSLYTSLEAFLPFIGSYVFSNIFSLSISTYPGMVYQFSAGVALVTMMVIMFEELFCHQYLLRNS